MVRSHSQEAATLLPRHKQFIRRVERHFIDEADDPKELLTYVSSAGRSLTIAELIENIALRQVFVHNLSLVLNRKDDNFVYRVDYFDNDGGIPYLKVTRFHVKSM